LELIQRRTSWNLFKEGLDGLTKQCYKGDEEAGEKHVEHVEHGSPSQVHVIRDVGKRMFTARVVLDVSLHVHVDQVKLTTADVYKVVYIIQR